MLFWLYLISFVCIHFSTIHSQFINFGKYFSIDSIQISNGNEVGSMTFGEKIDISYQITCASFRGPNIPQNVLHIGGPGKFPRLPVIYIYGSTLLNVAISDDTNINLYWNVNYNFLTNVKYNISFHFDLQSTKIWINNNLMLDKTNLNLKRNTFIGNNYPLYFAEGPGLYSPANCLLENVIIEMDRKEGNIDCNTAEPASFIHFPSATIIRGQQLGCIKFNINMDVYFNIECTSFRGANIPQNILHIAGPGSVPRLPIIFFYGSNMLQIAISDNANINRFFNILYDFNINTKYLLNFHINLTSLNVYINKELVFDKNDLDLNRDLYIGHNYPIYVSEEIYYPAQCKIETLRIRSSSKAVGIDGSDDANINEKDEKYYNYNYLNNEEEKQTSVILSDYSLKYLYYVGIIIVVGFIMVYYHYVFLKSNKNNNEVFQFEDEI